MDPEQVEQQASEDLAADHHRHLAAEGAVAGGFVGLVIALAGVWVARLRRRRRSP